MTTCGETRKEFMHDRLPVLSQFPCTLYEEAGIARAEMQQTIVDWGCGTCYPDGVVVGGF